MIDFVLESAFAILLHHAPTQYPARAARQWIPPSIPPEPLASGPRPVSLQSCSPVDPAQYPSRAARQWIPPSIPPERLENLLSSYRPQATRKPCLNSNNRVHGRKLVSVEGGDCSKRSNFGLGKREGNPTMSGAPLFGDTRRWTQVFNLLLGP